ncbi:MAG: hypothetical protein F4Y39_17030 [Gemmatimonadetes bacterium]|nr:hypothetical protein [Gemmatimonadota bacterium]MYC15427.1 hypothetical protein [Gemmatimonadota bacterium]MYD62104.1 hypothetical protein [Gemmatimonadota bacterium]MYK52697.1 hypothetical protein [Gemmatimonadota bacterium]
MGVLSFFTFLRSPVYIIIAFFAYLLLAHVWMSSQTDRISVFVLFFFLEFWGGTIGSMVGENQYRMLTWTLPHFRKRLLIWSATVGLFSVVAWTVALTYAPLNTSWSTILLLNLGLYCIGFALSGGWNFGIQNPGLASVCRGFIVFLGLTSAYLWQEILAFGEQQILGLALIAFAIAIGTHYFAFNQTAFRSKPFSLVLPLRLTLFPQTREFWKKNAMNRRKSNTRLWHFDHIGTGIFNWLRAGQYENSGLGRWGSPLSAFTAVFAMVFFFLNSITHMFGLWDRSPYDFETLSKIVYHMIFYFDQLDSKIDGDIFTAVFFGICMYLFIPPISLKRGYAYPLSRTQRMWIRYSSLLVQNISFFVASILVLGVLGILAGIKVGFVSEGDMSLEIFCVLGWWVVLLPMLQWLQVKYDLYGFQRTRRQIWGMAVLILGIILAFGITGFISLMRVWYPDLMLTYEAPVLFVCFILLQWFLLARLKRYYATQDLI